MGKTGSFSGGQGLAPVVVWLEATQPWVYRLYGRVNGDSKRVYAKGQLPVPPCGDPLPTHSSTGGPPILADSCGSVSCGATASLWVLVCTKFCLCPPKLESLYPLVLWKSYNQISLALKARFPGDSQPLCQIPRLGSLKLSSEPWQQYGSSFGIVLLSVGRPPGRYRILFYCNCVPPTFSLWLLLCLWMWVSFFWWILVSSCQWFPTANCKFGALAERDEHTPFYSTILLKRKPALLF